MMVIEMITNYIINFLIFLKKLYSSNSKSSKFITLAGDDVKFGFPAAQAMTTLAWGGVAYKAGYQSAGEWENLLAAVKWGTDYFIKCHTSDTEFYGQVCHVSIDFVSLKLCNI